MELSQHSALLPGISLASALPQNVGAISDHTLPDSGDNLR